MRKNYKIVCVRGRGRAWACVRRCVCMYYSCVDAVDNAHVKVIISAAVGNRLYLRKQPNAWACLRR